MIGRFLKRLFPRHMTCQRYVDLMTEYMEDDLRPADREIWERHFHDCDGCRNFFTGFKNSLELTRYVEEKGVPEPVRERVERVLVERARRRREELRGN